MVRGAAEGRMPSWFAATYHGANGEPDLERLWADVKGISASKSRAATVFQLRNEFGGYCDRRKATESAFENGVTRNPWRDGGCVPAAPRDVAATAVGGGKLTVSWDPPADDGGSPIEGYKVQWKSGTEAYDSSRQEEVTDLERLSHTIDGLTSGVEYSVRVVAYNHNGGGADSVETTATAGAQDTTAPQLSAATADGASLVLTWNETLDETSVPLPGAFEVSAGGTARGIGRVSVTGDRVTLTLTSAVAVGEAVTLSYAVPAGANASPLRDTAMTAAAGLSGHEVRNDTTAVTIVSDPGADVTYIFHYGHSSQDVIELTVTFSERVTVTGVPELALQVGTVTKQAAYAGGSGTTALTFRYVVADGDTDADGVSVLAGRIGDKGGTIQYLASNDAAPARVSLAAQPGHRVDGVRPALVSIRAVANGNVLTLTWDKVLDENSVPGWGDNRGFQLWDLVDGWHTPGPPRDEITAVSISGAVVTLDLSSTVQSGDQLVVSYTVPYKTYPPLLDTLGNYAGNNRAVIAIAASESSNTPPTGLPAISGTAQVGATLTASAGAIVDADGLENVEFAWQWIANDGAADADIAGATAATYTLTAADLGNTIKVRVTFTDDGGTEETLVSAATVTVAETQPPVPEITLGGGAFTVDEGETMVTTLTMQQIGQRRSDSVWSIPQGADGGEDADAFTLEPDGVLSFRTAKDYESPDDADGDGEYEVTAQFGTRTASARADLVISLRNVNEAPVADAGAEITGVSPGATVTLDGSGSSDPDRDDTLTWLWTQTDASGYAVVLSDAAAQRPTFTMPSDIAADAVLVFTLRVTDAGGLFAQDSVRVSVAPPPADAPAGTTEVLWSADVTVTDYGGAFGAITADSFTNVTGGELGVEWIWYSVGVRRLDLILSEAATAAGELTLHLDDVALAFPQGSSGETIIRWRPIRLSWKNGQTVAVRLTRTSQAPEPVNTSPTGLPAIAGTPRVGEALRASVSGIADADGLSGATFGYQWLSHDGTADTAISGATQAVYTLVASDAGNTIKVRVTFTDDRGTEETLTSVATAAVEATVPDAPRNLSIAAPDGKEGVLEVSWVAPSSDGGSAVAGYQVQWRSGFEDYDGTAASARQAAVTDLTALTHTISGLTNGVAYTVRVIATNGVGDGAATAGVTGTPRDRVRPELAAAAVDGDTLVLNYNEALDEASEPGASAFAVQAGAASRGLTHVAVSGNTVTLTLASAVSSSDEVTVRYVAPQGPGAKPIRDVSGNNAAPVLGRTVRNDTITEVTPFYPPDNDVTLRRLTYYYGYGNLWGDFIEPAFLGTTRGTVHSLEVRPSTESISMWAEPNNPGATVEFGPADADGTAGSQQVGDSASENDITIRHYYRVSLIEGENVITVTVTSADRSTTSTHTITVTRPSNSYPSGAPTIAGTARVGETLTASVSEIADEDGLGGATFTYHWIRSDGTTDTDIAAATQVSYTLVAADQGKTIKVRATFIDDGGTEEALTSAATAVVQDSLTLSVSDARATEGALVEFTVSLSAASSQQATVQYATADGTAESGADFTAASGTLTFAANETSKTVSVATTADAADEDNETFTLTLSSPTNAVLGDATATGTIVNDDEPEDTVSPTVWVQCVDMEANPFGPQVSDNHSLSWELHFSEPVTHADDTSARLFEIAGQDDTDFTWFAIGGLAGSLHHRFFTTPMVSLEIGSAVSEVNGVVITVPAGGWQDRSGNLNTASANSLYLAHNWKVSVADASATEGTDGTIVFEVTLNARDDCETVTVDWATADGTATAGEDYTAANGTLTFGPGETSKMVSVVILDDTAEDSGETLTLQLSNASGVTLADAKATGTISDEESLTLSVSDASATEGASLEFTVWLSEASAQPVTVQYATSGVTAQSGTDFTAASGTLTFAANETSKTVSVATTADAADEDNETFTLTLSSPTNAVLGDATATGTIVNDDEPEDTVSPTVWVQCVDMEANPFGPQVSDNHSLSWELHFSEPVTHADDTSARLFEIAGQDDTDFTWFAIGGLAGSLHHRFFTTPMVSLEIGSAVSEVNGVVITVPAGGWQDRSGNLNTASANSLYLAHNWKVSVADASATEGTDGTIVFEVTLNARDDCETVTVDWATADGTATAGEDYTAANGTLTFGPGETSKMVSVVILDDTVEDSGETFTLQLSNASGVTLADAEATGTISDEQSPFVSVPQIDGVPQVGNTLEVSFAEPPSGALAYQWLRGSEVIAGATASTYVPTVADVGARLSVRVERGGETLTSAPTAPVWPAPANPPLAEGEEELLSATVTLGSHQFPYWVAGYGRVLGASFGEMDIRSFEDGGTTYVVDAFLVNSRGVFALATGSTLPDASGLVAYWNGYRISGLETEQAKRGTLPMLAGRTPQPSTEYSRYEDGASDGVRVAVSLRRVTNNTSDSVNTPPTGLPAVSGTARVGETLTASETGIADVDGLSGATFAWQWIANDGSADAEIAGATGATYTLTAAELGKTVKVQVTFTDDGGTQETLVSAATGQVSAALTARFENVPERHDGATAFAVRIAFSEAVTTGVAALGDHAAEVTDGAVTGARRIDGRSDLWELSVEPASDTEVTVALPADRACDAAGALCTADGGRLSNRPQATIAGPLPAISIAAAASPVAEGTAAAFTLSRSGDTAAALPVAVVVAEDGAALMGAPPANVTFVAGAGTAELAVATDDDETAESASTVTATLEGGDGYAVEAAAASASVTVEDDDAAPVVTTATPIAAPENGTTVATLVATDTDTPAADLAWSIAGGADADKFTLTAAGVLAFKAAPDFEAPDDAGADGEYEVTVAVTDGANPVAAELTVRLTDVDDVAPVLTGASVDGATVTLTFDEALDESLLPPAGAFAVTVGTASRGVSGVSVDGSATLLTLASAVTADDTVEVTYSVPAEASARIRDTAGNAAAGFSRQAVTNATPVANTLPAGRPAIAGTPLVGATLTASADGIEDADGLAGAVFAWQWIVNDGSGDADIAGATEASYTLTAAEAGKRVKVRVTFTDDGGTEETLLSAATATVSAPLPEVSIAAAASPVTEGSAAVFVLRRSGATTSALTVTVSVTEAGDVLDGAAPSAVTFAANAAEARLRIATEDDAVAEADARVTATLAAGAGYRVAAAAAAAGVDVFDDEQAPSSAAVTLWSGGLEVGTYGGWIGALGDAVDDNGWTEDGVDYALDYVIYVPGELLVGFTRAPEQIDGLTLHFGEVELALADAGSGTTYAWSVELDWEPGMTVAVRLNRRGAAPAGPGVSVADATVREAAGAALRFRVTLEQPQATVVSVRYASADGTAVAGADYVAVRGALRFAPGETAKTVAVAVLDDAHEEGAETLRLTLTRPFGVLLSDAEATGTIDNEDPLPRSWLARFGRTAAEQVLNAVEERLRASQAAETRVTLAGHRVPSAPTAADPAALDAAADEQLAAWLRGDTAATGSRILTMRELLSESAFQVGAQTAHGGTLTLWGGGAFSRFGGGDGAVELDGDVWAGLLGVDYAQGGWLAGLALAYHESGGGSYRSPAADGALHSWLVGGYPYVGYAAGPLALWGAAGYGQGKLTLTATGDAPLETGIGLLLGAGGARGELLAPDAAGGAGLALNLDALVLRTSLEATPGLAAAEADVSRLRLGLEGSYALALGSGGRLTPTAELAVRHDGGHAETGFGLDLSGSLRWSAPALGLAAQVSGHGLLLHEAGFPDWGVAGSFSYDPDPASDLGPSLSLAPAWGGTATSGADALHGRPTMAGLTADAAQAHPRARITAEAAYGLPLFGAAGVGTPYLGLGLADGSRDYRLGYRLTVTTGPVLTLSIEGTRHESTHGAAPRHTISLQATRSW